MLNTFPNSSPIKSSFQNGAAAHFDSGSFFRDFSQTVYQNDANDIPLERYGSGALSICRTLSLIPHGLRGISMRKKRSHSVFREHTFE